jgi:D-glycero-D-manno-heptose 1,7-bisphosphate phosphatase
MTRAVFLDRDGVLVREIVVDGVARAPLRVSDFHILADAPDHVRRLQVAGFRCVVFTNQPEVARGLLAWETLQDMHDALRATTGVDEILTCPHDEADGCDCRKPHPGMLLAAARHASIQLDKSFVVGDRWRDIGAGHAAGCYSILIERAYSGNGGNASPDARVDTLAEAVDMILARTEATAAWST